MSPRRKSTLLIAAALIVLAVVAMTVTRSSLGNREPSYDGHPLSFWVASFINPTNGPSQIEINKATNAIDHIGVAALPFLVNWLQYDPPA